MYDRKVQDSVLVIYLLNLHFKVISPRFRHKKDKMPMKQVAFTMKLLPGFAEEYQRRHDEIWPSLQSLLKESGITDYHIFLDKDTHTLFAFQQTAGQGSSQELGSNEIVKKWWAYMADIMETNPDHSPVTKPLSKVFTLK